jgi:hypothetical protein
MTWAMILILQVDPKAVDRAIDSGADYLKKKVSDAGFIKPVAPPKDLPPGSHIAPPQERLSAELILWTFLHAGVPEKDPAYQKLWKLCLDQPLWRTYNVALVAMILQKVDAAKYKDRLSACLKFFVDTQCENGQWDYGDGYAPKKAFTPKKYGDNSNSQYAALGLRACRDGGLDVPEATLKRALAWWTKSQHKDGGWNYNAPPAEGKESPILQSYGSMTCGGVGSVAILEALLKQDPKKNSTLQKGLQWISEYFSASEHARYVNPGFGSGPTWWFYYYLYSLERAGDLLAMDKFGESEWYVEGAQEILKRQKSDGSWKEPSQEWEGYSTCFAILFLKRATQPVIKTEPAKKD